VYRTGIILRVFCTRCR